MEVKLTLSKTTLEISKIFYNEPNRDKERWSPTEETKKELKEKFCLSKTFCSTPKRKGFVCRNCQIINEVLR